MADDGDVGRVARDPGRSGDPAPAAPGGGSRGLRLVATACVAVEGLALLVAAVVLVVQGVGSHDAAGSVALAAVVGVVGAALAGCARGVAHGARWTRGPVLTWQLLQAGVGMPVSASAYWYFGVPILAVAVVTGVLIVGRAVIVPDGTPA